MELQLTHPYQAGIGRVLGAFFDKNHILEKNALLGARNVNVAELKKDEASAKLVVERQMTTSAEVPGMLASFHREWNQVTASGTVSFAYTLKAYRRRSKA